MMAAMSIPVPGGDPDAAGFVYDELSYFSENCAEYDIDPDGPAAAAMASVARVSHPLDDGRTLSGLSWGGGAPQLVLIHGGAQNAHTWDTVALALAPTPILAVDLPGHGHSAWRDDGAYDPRHSADDVAAMIAASADGPVVLVGMSLGGLTATAVAARHPELVRRLVVVDVTPGVTRDKAADVHAFIEGPQRFPDFGEIFSRTVEFNPTRSHESLRRGILHNAHRLDSGEWEWNYDRRHLADPTDPSPVPDDLWEDVAAVGAPYHLVRGLLSPVVDDADEAELRRLQPDAVITKIADAGHSIQGDQPIRLAELLRVELDAR